MRVSIFHAEAGHGHKKVAEVIAATFVKHGLSKDDVKVADALEWTPAYFKHAYPASYFYAVKHLPKLWGWFYEQLDCASLYKVLRPFRSLNNYVMACRLLKEIEANPPDVIICTHFLSAELFATAKRRGKIKSTLITVVTDFYPHSFWVNEGTDYYWVMAEEGRKDLERRGVPKEKIIAGGIPVEEKFKPLGRKQEFLKKWNFSEKRLTLLLTSGSFGLSPQEEILKALVPLKNEVQCFAVCGNNSVMRDRLKEQVFPFPVHVFGFVDFMPELMEASDLIVAKSGGATTTESLAKGLPMVVFQPIPGQETRNANVLRERNAAFFMEEPKQIETIVRAILENKNLLEAKRKEVLKLAKPQAAEDLVNFVLSLPRT